MLLPDELMAILIDLPSDIKQLNQMIDTVEIFPYDRLQKKLFASRLLVTWLYLLCANK
jgi:hypothetical protein